MMLHRARETGDFVAASLAAVLIAGLIYLGVLLLNTAEKPDDFTMVDGAIRITKAVEEKPVEPLRHKKPKEIKPPKQLPKTFSSKSKPKNVRPRMNLSAPSFTADMLPGLKGDIALPRMEVGSVNFSMDEVDEKPQIVRSVSPEYPYNARRNHIEGEVVVRMLVTSKGVPTNLSVYKANPPGMFERSALSAAKRWRFRPGRYQGKAVDTWVLLPFNFELTQ